MLIRGPATEGNLKTREAIAKMHLVLKCTQCEAVVAQCTQREMNAAPQTRTLLMNQAAKKHREAAGCTGDVTLFRQVMP